LALVLCTTPSLPVLSSLSLHDALPISFLNLRSNRPFQQCFLRRCMISICFIFFQFSIVLMIFLDLIFRVFLVLLFVIFHFIGFFRFIGTIIIANLLV